MIPIYSGRQKVYSHEYMILFILIFLFITVLFISIICKLLFLIPVHLM